MQSQVSEMHGQKIVLRSVCMYIRLADAAARRCRSVARFFCAVIYLQEGQLLCMMNIEQRRHSTHSIIGPIINKENLSQIQFYSIFSELLVTSNTVVIMTVCVKVVNSTGFPQIKGQWAELSRYYLCMLFCKVIFDYRRLTVTR